MIGVDVNSLLFETRDMLDKVRKRLDDAFEAMSASWERMPPPDGMRRVWDVQLTCGHSQHYYSKPVMGDHTWCSKCPGIHSRKSWVRTIFDESIPAYNTHKRLRKAVLANGWHVWTDKEIGEWQEIIRFPGKGACIVRFLDESPRPQPTDKIQECPHCHTMFNPQY